MKKIPLIPSKTQWQSWKLPSKLTAIGAYAGVIGVIYLAIQASVAFYQYVDKVSTITLHSFTEHEVKAFNADKYGILIGPFFGNSDELNEKGREFQHSLAATLKARFIEEQVFETEIVELRYTENIFFTNHGEARSVGSKLKAEMVIWGDVTIKGIIPKITIVNKDRYSSKLLTYGGDITILKNSLRHDFINSLTEIRMPFITKEPTIIAMFSVGLRCFDRGEYGKALGLLRKALPRDPLTIIKKSDYIDVSQILTLIGLCYLRLSEDKKAISTLKRAHEISPVNLMAGLALAAIYHHEGDSDKATEIFIKVRLIHFLKNKPAIAKSLNDLQKGNYDSIIIRMTKELKDGDSEKEIAYLLRGFSYYNKRDFDKAIVDFNDLINSMPRLSMPYRFRALSYYAIGFLDKAILDFNMYESLEPQVDSELYGRRGCSYRVLGEYGKALADLNKAIELNPYYLFALICRGSLFAEWREHKKAINDLNLALKIKPDHTYINFVLGLQYDMLGDIDKAVVAFKKVTKLDPDGFLKDEDIDYAKRRIDYIEGE